MAGKDARSFVVPARRAGRRALAIGLALAAALVPVAATASGAATTSCVVDPGQANSYGGTDSNQLIAGTGFGPDYGGYSTMGALQDMGASVYYHNNDFGQGIDVAVIDTGVSPVQGLNSTNLITGPDFSFESQNPHLAHFDTNGHGTFMASLIAGRDATLPMDPTDPSLWSNFTGVAPYARVVSVKVADSQGAVDVTQVIAAIDWVTAHAHDHGLNIRVLNLSIGFPVIDKWTQDALSYAVDQAWRKANIVVVAAAGNSGPGQMKTYGGTTNPGYNNEIISVGAYDTNGTPKYDANGVLTSKTYYQDDKPAPYSSGSNSFNPREPDFVAPGEHLIGLHVPGSNADLEMYDTCMYPDPNSPPPTTPWATPVFGPSDRFVHGSGTSEAAALTSGAVALMLSKNPTLTPDQVKQMLRTTAIPFGAGGALSGQGEINLVGTYAMTPPAYSQNKTKVATGGSMDQARGGYLSALTKPYTVYHQYLTTFVEKQPGACTNYYANIAPSGAYINPDPTNLANLEAAYDAYCTEIPLQDKVDAAGKPIYTDIFGRGIALSTLQANEAKAVAAPSTNCPNPTSCSETAAWQTVTLNGKTYQIWMGDATLTSGTGFVSDPVFGQVWGSGLPWPATDYAGQPFTGTTTQSWAGPTQGFSLRGYVWQRFSLTGEDWTSHSLRSDNWG
jgi:serine protease AprX